MSSSTPRPFVVLKFGGTSVSSHGNWQNIAGVIRERLDEGLVPVVVHSALSGVTDLLEKLLVASFKGEAQPLLDEISARHRALAAECAMPLPATVSELIEQLTKLCAGITLLNEVGPRVRARVLAFGELLATRMGEAFLQQHGLAVHWLDARTLLRSQARVGHNAEAEILSATCHYDPNPELQQSLRKAQTVYITQGFIAADESQQTVVLGRGGSDTSGSYLAAILEATRLEIWTDVPGMFSANPRGTPDARLLRQLHYDEAQEIASSGAKVLHPRCIAPVRQAGIPLYLYATQAPTIQGTKVCERPDEYDRAQVKAIAVKKGITLISMESPGMWHQVGWLADVFQVFKAQGLSVDLISTSETSVTVTLDPSANALSANTLHALTQALAPLARTEVIGPCAALSLVGRHIRSLMPELGEALKSFADVQVYLISQAANDLNFTVVVEEAEADDLVTRLHELLINPQSHDALWGPRFEELFSPAKTPVVPWWQTRRMDILEVMKHHASAYVYDTQTIQARARQLKSLRAVSQIHYAMKANFNPEVLAVLAAEGIGFECVSLGEIDAVLSRFPNHNPKDILYTPNFADREELRVALGKGVQVTLDSVYPLEHWPELFQSQSLFIRVDTGTGHGHHQKVKTAGAHTKFGVPLSELASVQSLARAAGARIIGLHAHTGSGHFDVNAWRQVALCLIPLRELFPEVRVIDLGGGLGVPTHWADPPMALDALDAMIAEVKASVPEVEFWLEPGRFLVAEAGVLAARVTQLKGKGQHQYCGLATGMNSLIRPALYDAHHEIVNLTRWSEPASVRYDVVGPICESADVLAKNRFLPKTHEGDVLLILTAGAYGRAMSSRYNLREPAIECVI